MARRSSSLAALSTTQISQELRRRQRTLPKLNKKRAKLVDALAAIDAQIAELGGSSSGGGGGGKRPKNTMTLVEALEKVLKGKQMSVAEAMAAVKTAGYKTNSNSFRISVNATLLKFKKKFKKVARGIYTAA